MRWRPVWPSSSHVLALGGAVDLLDLVTRQRVRQQGGLRLVGIEVRQAGAKGDGRQGGPRFPIDDRCQCPQEIDDRCQCPQDALATPAHSATEKAQASHLIATLIEYQSSCTTEQLVAQGSCRDIAGVPASFLGLGNCVAVPTSAELPSRPSCQGARSGKTQTRNTHTQHNTHTTQPHRE